MSDNDTGFKITDSVAGFYRADFNDVFINKNCFTDGRAGLLWVMGYNQDGRLGDNTLITKSSPVQTISIGTNWKSIDTQRASGGIKTDGTLWLWGRGADGVLGNGSTTNRSSPVQTLLAGNDWKNIVAGCRNTAAIKTDGTLWIWGEGRAGNLGNDSSISRSIPVQTISGGTNWKQVSLGDQHAAAIKTDGTLWVWGSGRYGALGTNTNTSINISSPIQTISGGTNWNKISLAGYKTAAIKTDGTLWMWGYNNYGALGDNTRIDRSSPVQTISGGNDWKETSIGSRNSSAIKTDGTLWLWGHGNQGRLGNNTNTSINMSSPVQTISGGTNWRHSSFGPSHVAAIKTDGTLWVWGDDSQGQTGSTLRITRSSPVQTISAGTSWRCVATGNSVTIALKSETIC